MPGLHILVTGGAGFIGSHIVDLLLEKGHRVRVLDNLAPQVHGNIGNTPPKYLNPEAEFIHGDVCDPDTVRRALDGIDVVYHKAAAVGVGQSMYEILDFCNTNVLGTANLLEIIIGEFRDQIQRIIVASSMSIYGEGRYMDPETGCFVIPAERTGEQMAAGQWELYVPGTQRFTVPAPCDENKLVNPTSIYAINKRDQEEMVLITGRAYRIPAVALRYFNVYGPRQALSNPYTGVAAIFCGCYLNENPPTIFEDGKQSRDFVHVHDIARANLMALEKDEAVGQAINIGTGTSTPILEVDRLLRENLCGNRAGDSSIQPKITGRFRTGDIRHCYADITRARELLGYEPSIAYRDGVPGLIEWVRTQKSVDRTGSAIDELQKRELV